MDEYIEREAAKNAFPRAEADAFENCRYCTCLDSEQIGEILDNIPATDVVPVRHGRWILRSDEYQNPDNAAIGNMEYECSECGHGDVHHTSVDVKYCWFCGARMDKDGDGDV